MAKICTTETFITKAQNIEEELNKALFKDRREYA